MSQFYSPAKMEFGAGSLNNLGNWVIKSGGSHVLLIISTHLTKPPIKLHEKIMQLLQTAHIKCTVFTNIKGEPTTDFVDSALQVLKDAQCDCVVAVGGGSYIDLAKAVSLFALNPELQWDAITKQPLLQRLPLLAVPTTAGSGSEATKVMVITNTKTNFKMNPGHPDLIPDVTILDPELSLSLPRDFTCFTGMDALTHAIEAYLSNRATELTDIFALSAIRLIAEALPLAYENGSNLEARDALCRGSYYAGIAFSNASTNLAHAAGRPLGVQFHIPHGLSVALLLPFVMSFGLKAATERYANIAEALGVKPTQNTSLMAQKAIETVTQYHEAFGLWQAAKKYILSPEDLIQAIPFLVKDALSGNGIDTNRQIPTEKDITVIYTGLAEKLS